MLAMRHLIAGIGLLALACGPVAARAAEDAPRALRFTGEPPYRLTLLNPVGNVTLLPQAPGAGPTVTVAATRVKPRAVVGPERDLVAVARLDASLTDASSAKVETDFAKSGLSPVQIAATLGVARFDYVVRVPAKTEVTVRLERGDLRAENLDGALDLRTRTGALRVHAPAGPASLETEQGEIAVTRPASALAVGTHSGRVSVVDPRGDVTIRSASGAVSVRVSPRYAAFARIDTVSGKFYSDLTPFESSQTPDARGYAGILRGPLAGMAEPGVRLGIATIAGDVTLRTDRQLRAPEATAP